MALRAALHVLDATRPGLRAVGYLRVSTEDQKRGYGVPAQDRKVRRHMERKSWVCVRMYADEAVSGSLEADERPELRVLMTAAREGRLGADVVVVNEGRAIGRTGRAFWRWVWELEDLGIFTAIVDKDIDNTTPQGRSAMRKEADYAEEEWERIRARTVGGSQMKAESGGAVGGRPPWPYEYIDKGKTGESRLGLPEDGKAAANCGRKAFVQHLGWSSAARAMNDAGYRRQDGGEWTEADARARLTSPVVLEARQVFRKSGTARQKPDGTPLYGDQVIIDLPPVFTPGEVTEFLAAIKTAKSGRRPVHRKHWDYILTGLATGPCGGGLTGFASDEVSPAYYHRGCPTCPRVPAGLTEQDVWDKLRTVLTDADRMRAMIQDAHGRSREGEAKSAAGRVADLEEAVRQQDEVLAATTAAMAAQAVSRGLLGEEAQAYIARATAPLEEALKGLTRELTEARAWVADTRAAGELVGRLEDLARQAAEHLEVMDAPSKRRVFELLGARVKVLGPSPARRSGGCLCHVTKSFQCLDGVPEWSAEAWARVTEQTRLQATDANRLRLEQLLLKARKGLPWTQVNVNQTTFSYWRKAGIWDEVLAALQGLPVQPLAAATPPPTAVTFRPFAILKQPGQCPRGWDSQLRESPEMRLVLTLGA